MYFITCSIYFSIALHVSGHYCTHLQEHNCIIAAIGVWICGDYNIISWWAFFYILCELVFSRLFIVKGVVVSFAIYVLVCVFLYCLGVCMVSWFYVLSVLKIC